MDTTASGSHDHMGLWYITTQVPVVTDIRSVFYVVTSLRHGYHNYSCSHYHMGLWYITTQVPVVTDIPVVFYVVTLCTTGQYHYHMDTTTSCSHYHMGLWYITTQVPVVTEIPVVFYVVTSCTSTTGITTQYFHKGRHFFPLTALSMFHTVLNIKF